MLSAIFNFAIKHEYTNENPARKVGNIELTKEKHINFWTLEEFKSFIKHVDDPLYYALFMILYYSGMRKGELLALTWGDIDFETNTININKTVHNSSVTSPKTKASIRTIMMPTHIMELLTRLKTNQKSSYVIFGEFSTHIPATTLQHKYDKYIKIAEIKKSEYMISGTPTQVI